MGLLAERDRSLLFLWYVKQDAVEDVARTLGISAQAVLPIPHQGAPRVVVDETGSDDRVVDGDLLVAS